MKSKLTIKEFSVKSFVTEIKTPHDNCIKGGGRTLRVNATDCCTFHPRFC
ncbi:MAG: pinensin family lanthipeptide [Cyclobacteriaceae bacterium]